ncbi:uncharacterized protein LOC131850179 [Achroia grisella]|uniref:uncharacterized protein LOC131850179 n=1 Tax=Achroia grisella TaxID=688607 RepID=UPI0027D32DB6|nr:uncharacterized protein LOC131850179 [Achroia grisella]
MATVSEMDQVQLLRKVVRRRFTMCAKKIEEYLDKKDKVGMSSEIINITKIFDELTLLQNRLMDLWLNMEQRDENFFDKDLESSEAYNSQFYLLKHKVSEYCSHTVSRSSASDTVVKADSEGGETSQRHRRHFRLPKLQLAGFNGEIKSWIPFWTQFKKIDADSDIDDEDKFQYLLQSIETGCSARDLVESFPPSAENYPKVIQQLKQRYAKDELIIEHYVRELLKLTIVQRKDNCKMSTRTLYDKLMTQILALESLGVTQDKYAAFLFPMVESALPEDILRAWNRYQINVTTDDKGKSQLTQLLHFVRNEVESEEKINLSRGGFANVDPNPVIPSASFLTTSIRNKEKTIVHTNNEIRECVWCAKSTHNSSECKTPIKWNLEERKDFLKKKNSCLICLITGHHAKKCRKYPKCVICEKRHYPIMCVELQKSTKKSEDEKSMLKQSTKQSTVLLQTVKLHLFHEDQVVTVRALLDSGAQRSFIRSDVIDKLKIVPTGNEHLRHNLFGGVVTKLENHRLFTLNCKSLDNKYKLQIEALEQKKICDNLPKVKPGILLSQLQAKGINITDCVDEVTEISLLIGSDVLGSLYTGRSEHVSDNLVAIETKFGWVIQGPTSGMYSIFTSVHACSFDIDDLWKLESIGIKDEAQVKSIRKREEEVENFFRETIVRNDEDRYEIKLPWNDTADLLSPNYNLALKRLHSTTNKLNKLGLLTAYDEVFGEWLDSNIIEEVVDDNPQIGHYLPHQVVVKDSSLTTRIRPVFDASAITKEGVCLNACLKKGSNLIELIPKLLIQFRKGAIGITADIKKAFLQISIHPDDRKFLKFLWWNNPSSADRKLKVFRHRRVVFGVTTSPYLLSATILYHLEKYECETASLLKNSFYVDNCIVSVNNEVEMEKFINEALNIMNEGKFELRCWVTGPTLDINQTDTSVLGVTWNSQTDELYCKVPFLKQIDTKLTKRVLLSMAQSIFDPIGFLCPTTLIPKLLIQKCWERTMDWDKELTLELEKSAKEWLQQVSSIEKCRIPRRLSKCNLSDCNNTIHTFSDASQYAYSGCVFLRSE